MADFNTAVNIVLKHEGGYVNNPDDPGGETNFGISKARYPHLDIASLTREQARGIYYNDFWLNNRLNEIINQNVANFALDTVVNHGQGGTIIQRALTLSGQPVTMDNRIGTQTITALNRVNPDRFIYNGIKERKRYYNMLISKNPALAQFKSGWYRRVSFFLLKTRMGITAGVALTALLIWYLARKR